MSIVALALSENVGIFELAAPCTIFGTGRPPEVEEWYDFRVCSPRHARVDQWFRTTTEHTYDDLVTADTVIVPACHDGDLCPPPRLVEAVRAAYARGARVMSICTGAFVLAEAGILDGRRAATHWMYADRLARRHPRVRVDPNVLYVDEGQVLTSAGKAAGTDLCLYVVRRDHGAAVANAIARRLVTPPHREGGQAQFVSPRVLPTPADGLAQVMDWALENLSRTVTVEHLAARAHLSPRTLNRHFHARVGTNPLHWLQQQRVQRAQELLERTDLGVDQVATQSGFGTAAVLRRQFRRTLDTTPDAYRRTFNSAGDRTPAA